MSSRSTATREFSSALLGTPFCKRSFYDPKVGVNVMSRTLADHISSKQPLTFFHKHLMWIDGQIMESEGILRVVPLVMGNNRVYLDFLISNIMEGEEFILI